ncbi:hypothetical protein [Motilibacter deserti]|uniref:WD40 repeat protein n=1 Tax=Motilibacter deserti TaxID=2714956 RepID=A0ABX0GUU4_9ACTN|nr:hypothetical protein [Motilibacter deserti]NHC13911.1 hypothetical protein [Motilibacter deserti]
MAPARPLRVLALLPLAATLAALPPAYAAPGAGAVPPVVAAVAPGPGLLPRTVPPAPADPTTVPLLADAPAGRAAATAGYGIVPRSVPAVPQDSAGLRRLADAAVQRVFTVREVLDWSRSVVEDPLTGERISAPPAGPRRPVRVLDGYYDRVALDADGGREWLRLPSSLTRRETFPSSGLGAPLVLAPDGRHVGFGTASRGAARITVLAVASGRTRSYPVASGATATDLQFSPDGHRLAFALGRAAPGPRWNRTDLAVLDLRSGAVRTLLADRYGSFAWSPDSRRVAAAVDDYDYAGNEPTLVARRSVLVDVASGRATPLARPGGQQRGGPVFSSDGREVWLLAQDREDYRTARTVLVRSPVDGRAARVVRARQLPAPTGFLNPVLGRRGNALLMTGLVPRPGGATRTAVYALSPTSGRVTPFIRRLSWFPPVAVTVLEKGRLG